MRKLVFPEQYGLLTTVRTDNFSSGELVQFATLKSTAPETDLTKIIAIKEDSMDVLTVKFKYDYV